MKDSFIMAQNSDYISGKMTQTRSFYPNPSKPLFFFFLLWFQSIIVCLPCKLCFDRTEYFATVPRPAKVAATGVHGGEMGT